jgi:hypothetical protein
MNTDDFSQLFPTRDFNSILIVTDEHVPTESAAGIEYSGLARAMGMTRQSGKWDLVVINLNTPGLEQAGLSQMISLFRDILARRLVILLDQQPGAEIRQQLIGLGLHQLSNYPGVFYHDLYDYKPTPDWLNNRFWANPELWNKYRW